MSYEFKTDVDSEVLIHGYDAWEPRTLQKLRQDVSFVIYDAEIKSFSAFLIIQDPNPFTTMMMGDAFHGLEIKAFWITQTFKGEFNEELLPIHLSFEFIPVKRNHVATFISCYQELTLHKNGKTETHLFPIQLRSHWRKTKRWEDASKKIRQIVKRFG